MSELCEDIALVQLEAKQTFLDDTTVSMMADEPLMTTTTTAAAASGDDTAPSTPTGTLQTAATSSKGSRTNSLGKLFQKMRSSEVLARLKKEGGGGEGCVDGTGSKTATMSTGPEQQQLKTGTLKKCMGSWTSCWQKSSAKRAADSTDADYRAYDEMHNETLASAPVDDTSYVELPHSSVLTTAAEVEVRGQ